MAVTFLADNAFDVTFAAIVDNAIAAAVTVYYCDVYCAAAVAVANVFR